MKNTFYLMMLLLTVIPSLAIGQGLILKAAFTSTRLVGDDVENNERLLRWQAGINFSIPITESLHVTPGLSYATRGALFEDGENLDFQVPIRVDDQIVMTLRYIDLVLPLKYILNDRVYALGGFYQSFLISKNAAFTHVECIDGNCTGFKEDLNTDFISDSDQGIVLGLGVRVFNDLAIEGVLQHGFHNLFDQEDRVSTQSFNFGLAYHF